MLYDPGKELGSLDFAAIIGGPLKALVQAQSGAAMTTIEFIRAVGFKPKGTGPGPGDSEANEPVTVNFTYKKDVFDPVTSSSSPQTYTLQVPILTMLPIPSLRIQEATLDFNVKITATEYTKSSSSLGVNASLDFRQSWGSGNINLKASVAYQKQDASGGDIARSFSMAVHVKMVQDELPQGLERIINILENQITEKKES